MGQGRELRCYDYVNKTYPAVRDALIANAPTIFSGATKAAATRAESLAATLHTSLGPIDVGADIEIEVEPAVEEKSPGGAEKTRLGLRWKAKRGAALFPAMEATLLVYPLTSSETQLELRGVYRPPLGALGTVIDGLIMHRVAEASVLRFVCDIAHYLGATVDGESG